MSKGKARLATAAFCILFFGLLADLYDIMPESRLWILWAFAIPGAWKFVRCVFIWLTTDDIPVEIKIPKWLQRNKKPKTYQEWAEANK